MSERKNSLHPFTQQQKTMMEEHYGLIQWFLSFRWAAPKNGSAPKEHPFSFLEKEDLYDAALDGYMHAVQQYDERPDLQRYSFTTIAVNAMRWEVMKLVKREARRLSRMNQDSSAYEAALRILSNTPEIGEQSASLETGELWDHTQKLVTIRQGNVLRLRSFGHTYTEIAQRTGINQKAVDNCLYKARKKLRIQLAA